LRGSSEFNEFLGLGKASPEVLKRSVFSKLPLEDTPKLDGGNVPMTGRAVVSHSPSIGVPIEALGFFAFHYAASNVAARFAVPRHLILGIYLPPKTREGDLRLIAEGLGDEVKSFGVTVISGHTATYKGIEIPLVTATCLGEPVRRPESPQKGDHVIIVGAIGGEAIWLEALSKGEGGDEWRRFTPLPAALSLQDIDGIRLMHDVSEGGLKAALLEIAEAVGMRIEVESRRMVYAGGAERLDLDVLRAPTYGSLIVVTDPDTVDKVETACTDLRVDFADVGLVTDGSGVFMDGEKVALSGRIALDEVYGTFADQDEVLNVLRIAVSELLARHEVARLIPQIGTNMVYARQRASSDDDIVAVDGRIIGGKDKPKICGEVVYGGSMFMSSVVLEAMKIDPSMRAAVNIRGGEDVTRALRRMGLSLSELPPVSTGDACPVAVEIEKTGKLFRAYCHPGAFGLEPTTTLLAETPLMLVSTLAELASHV
jgi:hydrogenase maturation factor/predicted fused transcriptional regulator/phosphomethylpyrimidine kinase